MREIKKINEEIVFDDAISEVTSISLDTDFSFSSNDLDGRFIITGTVKEHDLSTLETDFKKEIPFNETFSKEIVNGNIEVTDFTYDIDADKVLLDIEYILDYEEVIDDKSEIEDLINDEDVIVCDLRDEEEKLEENVLEEKEESERKEEVLIEEELKDEEYITYHVYVTDEFDTIDTISNKFNISLKDLNEYNEITDIKKGMKIIIPEVNE